MEKFRSLDDITRLYDVVAIGVIVTMNAQTQGDPLDLEALTAQAEARIKEHLEGAEEWYDDDWRAELVKVITERLAEMQPEEA